MLRSSEVGVGTGYARHCYSITYRTYVDLKVVGCRLLRMTVVTQRRMHRKAPRLSPTAVVQPAPQPGATLAPAAPHRHHQYHHHYHPSSANNNAKNPPQNSNVTCRCTRDCIPATTEILLSCSHSSRRAPQWCSPSITAMRFENSHSRRRDGHLQRSPRGPRKEGNVI